MARDESIFFLSFLTGFLQRCKAGERDIFGIMLSSAAIESLFRLLVQLIFIVGIILPEDKGLKSVYILHFSASNHERAEIRLFLVLVNTSSP